MTIPRYSLLVAVTLAASVSQTDCKKVVTELLDPDTTTVLPTLAGLHGTCAVEKFEIWSTNYSVPPAVRLLYDAVANGYVATLRITTSSRVRGGCRAGSMLASEPSPAPGPTRATSVPRSSRSKRPSPFASVHR